MGSVRIAAVIVGFALSLAGPGAVADAAPASRMKGSQFSAQARVKLATARVTALHARPGTITDEELSSEKGGSGLRYAFDITRHGKAYEVGVDARTGAILENVAEGGSLD